MCLLRVLAEDKENRNEVDQTMMSEATISRWEMIILSMIVWKYVSRQIPKGFFDHNYLPRLRCFGIQGSRNGHYGRSTYFYTKVNMVDGSLFHFKKE